MTIPKFASPEEADAWLEQQAKERKQYVEHVRIANEIVSIRGPVWIPDNGDKVLYSTVRTSVGKFAVAVFNPKLEPDEGQEHSNWGRCVYAREFAKRKDAKARAEALWAERNKARRTKAGNPL